VEIFASAAIPGDIPYSEGAACLQESIYAPIGARCYHRQNRGRILYFSCTFIKWCFSHPAKVFVFESKQCKTIFVHKPVAVGKDRKEG